MLRIIVFLVALGLLAQTACSGSSGFTPQSAVPETVFAPGTASELLEDPFVDGNGKGASAFFHKMFLDSVNNHSMGRWTVADNGGRKSWGLSNTAFSGPKSWIIGANYYGGESDTLTSRSFTIPANLERVKLAFHTRWQLGAGDSLSVAFSDDDGTTWSEVVSFADGSNADYPNWNKHLFVLPGSASERTCRLRLSFTSNGVDHGWGAGIDSVAVYQTLPTGPTGLSASDAFYLDRVVLNWTAPANPGDFTGVTIYRGATAAGPFVPVDSVTADVTSYIDVVEGPAEFYYRVVASREGYVSSAPSTDAGSTWPAEPPPAPGIGDPNGYMRYSAGATAPFYTDFYIDLRDYDTGPRATEGIELYASDSAEGPFELVTNYFIISYEDIVVGGAGLLGFNIQGFDQPAGTTTYYRVKLTNRYGATDFSSVFQFTDIGDDPIFDFEDF
jgi:hypothetical protein